MLNDLEVYKECGRRAAQAVNQKDLARAGVERDYFSRMRRLEKPEDRDLVRLTYDNAYAAARTVKRA
jgi:hypothetical protein